jgi:mRNA interferase RelE/StbE
MAYHVNFTKTAFKELERIQEPYFSALKKAVYNLADTPRPHGCKKLKGSTSYRIRVGDYRVIYDIFDSILVIEVITLGHRKDMYQ